MAIRLTTRHLRGLKLEILEDRTVFDVAPGPIPDPIPIPPAAGQPPLAVDDLAQFMILQTSWPVNVLANDLDGNPGATWDFSTLTVVHEPYSGVLTLDATTGVFLFTPKYLIPPGLPPGEPPPSTEPDHFSYYVKDSLGMQSNTARVDLIGIGGPKDGEIAAMPDLGFTVSEQPVVLDLLANDEIRLAGRDFDYASVQFMRNSVTGEEMPSSRPQHGTVTFDPTTGAATYTPDFGYVGWDRFVYEVSTTAGGPGDPLPGQVFTSSDEVFVIINTSPPRLQDDPLGGKMLVVDGTNGADTIQIVPGDRWCEVKAIVNGVTSPSFRPTSRVLVFGYRGNDTITVDPRVEIRTWLVGGLGNDTLKAGGGSALLMGNEGDDKLTGGFHRDLLIGGDGMDSLFGGFSKDLLVGGTTQLDSQPAELANAFHRWIAERGHARHCRPWWAAAQRYNARDVLSDTDVLDDGDQDTLDGGPGKDKIFATTSRVVDVVVTSPAKPGQKPRR